MAPCLVYLAVLAGFTAGAPVAAAPKTEFVIDTSRCPDMAEYGQKVKTIATVWYPKIAAMLPSDGYTPPAKVVFVFDPDYKGVAEVSGDRVTCSTDYFSKHPDDLGAFVHELVHVVQSYRTPVPGWLVEGIADHVRFYSYEPERNRPRPDPTSARFTDSYRTSAAFLEWCSRKYDQNLVKKLNAECRQGEYREELWKRYTGKTLAQLGEEWQAALKKQKS